MMDKWTQQINRIISIALVISLLFAGMYVDIVPAEDLFVYDMTGKAAASLAPAQSDTNNDAICTAELPAVQNADLQSRTSYQQQYRETNEFLYLQCFGSRSLSHGNSCIHHITTYLFYRTQAELLTEYMYQSDGKKRI